MIRKIIYTFLVLLLLAWVGGCQGVSPTPPVPWPNSQPGNPQQIPTTQVEAPEASSGNDGLYSETDGDGGSSGPAEPLILAMPRKIYTADYANGADLSAITSLIKVRKGFFKAGSEISVWATTEEEVNSPPYILAEDLDPDKPNIQGLSWWDGRVEFRVMSGYSAGTYTIYVSDGMATASVNIVIEKAY